MIYLKKISADADYIATFAVILCCYCLNNHRLTKLADLNSVLLLVFSHFHFLFVFNCCTLLQCGYRSSTHNRLDLTYSYYNAFRLCSLLVRTLLVDCGQNYVDELYNITLLYHSNNNTNYIANKLRSR